ncbi:MAG: tRNA (adenosine(37)-N6)-threonylcarbamoyltransferase complex ATPase subunit type 1 TsaE [Parcubacteria group bacterium]|jgi:tRNA threonylcarbamoyladenosine biosynthesis protein TsaE|nr:tRNA (adenosine(37)-N6)-threonylcarbamoyltransferase complex ATPase subunit type 1 TsaE [Parcubacteria group bacterium]
MEFISKNLTETSKITFDFIDNLKPATGGATVVGLYGDLGAGKTTFMKYLAEALGLEEVIQSPTFVIMKFFNLAEQSENARFPKTENPKIKGFQKLIHIDAYRIEEVNEMLVLGWDNIVSDPKNLVCVEWPEKITSIMPPHIKIFFEHLSENARKIKIKFNEEN